MSHNLMTDVKDVLYNFMIDVEDILYNSTTGCIWYLAPQEGDVVGAV